MTKFPIVEFFCPSCIRTFYGSQRDNLCPLCLGPLVEEAS